jgi:hypothetical protein
VITGLVGLIPRDDDALEINPLAPADWDFFALDDVSYRGHRITVIWDKTGQRYKRGTGLSVLVDGKSIATSATLQRVVVANAVPAMKPAAPESGMIPVNFAVNNDGSYYPRLSASWSSPKMPLGKLNDGNYWYMRHPPNRWTCEGSPHDHDWVIVDFGSVRKIHTVTMYLLDDTREQNPTVTAPERIRLEAWSDGDWQLISNDGAALTHPAGHFPRSMKFRPLETLKLRVTLYHRGTLRSGLSEIEAWGDAILPIEPVPLPAGNLAHNPGPKIGEEAPKYPKVSASHTSRFDKVEFANDRVVNFLPEPNNRWTSFESTSPTDWLEIDFGKVVEFRRVELAIYDDGGGVQAPQSVDVQHWSGRDWIAVENPENSPSQPVGGQWNEVRFNPVKSSRLRIVFTHKGQARSGVTEVMVWDR